MHGILQLVFKNLYVSSMNVVDGFYNQGLKTLLCCFHQILMGNKMFSLDLGIVDMSTMFNSS
jgi:hypothetical protein